MHFLTFVWSIRSHAARLAPWWLVNIISLYSGLHDCHWNHIRLPCDLWTQGLLLTYHQSFKRLGSSYSKNWAIHCSHTTLGCVPPGIVLQDERWRPPSKLQILHCKDGAIDGLSPVCTVHGVWRREVVWPFSGKNFQQLMQPFRWKHGTAM